MVQEEKKYKEIRITKRSEIIEVSADYLWGIIRNFEDVGKWFSSVDYAYGYGEPEFEGATCSERTCHVAISGFDKVEEKLTLFDEQKRELAYELTQGGPSFLLFAQNHWKVKEVGANQCILQMDACMRLKRFMGFLFGAQIRKTIEKNLPTVMNELKIFAESGEVSKEKKARMQKLEKKKLAKVA